MRATNTYQTFENCLKKIPKPKQVKTDDYEKGTLFPIISQEEKLISGYCDDESMLFSIDKPVVIFGDHTRILKYIDFDFVVGADGVKVLSPIDELDAKFLFYYLTWYNVPSLGYSRHYKLLKDIEVPIPDKIIQNAVIKELDQINALIEIKEKQLRELEELEQTIFHEMFGDPVDNENGWDVKAFSDCFTLKSGTCLPSKKICLGEFPIYGGNGIVGYHNVHNLEGNNIIIGRVGALCGNVRNVLGNVFVTDNAFIMTKKIDMNNKFIEHLLTHINLRTYAHDALQPVISNSTLKNINVIFPPKALQMQFAERMQQVEILKENLSKVQRDLQELLASRMQYWFD